MHTTDVSERLTAFTEHIKATAQQTIGFPTALDFDYKELFPLFDFMLNNIGDPFHESLYALHSDAMEREVITFFADLFRAPQDDRWLYFNNC
jgi:histidine decarboxylase